jgi:hypothetical protein
MKRPIWMLPPAIAIVTSLSVFSCSKSETRKPVTYSESAIRLEVAQARADIANGNTEKGTADLRAAAEKYARMGELLLLPEGFEYADEMFGKALDADPNNQKANFYKAITEPALLAKGFIPRVERLFTTETELRDLERFRHDVAKYELPELTAFATKLPAGEKAFISYYDAQRYAREKVLPALKQSVARLEKIDLSIAPLRLNINPYRLSPEGAKKEYHYTYSSHWCNQSNGDFSCQDYNYEGTYGDRDLPRVYMIDKHDLKVIRSSYAAMVASVQVGTAYSFKDIEYAIRRLKAIAEIRHQRRKHLTAEDVTQLLSEFPDLLTLENDHQLSEVSKIATEALKNALSLDEMKDQLCSTQNGRNKKNATLAPMCLTVGYVEAFRLGVDLLAGPKEIVLGSDSANNEVRILMDLTRVLKNPIADIKSLLPTEFDEAGRPVRYPDTTMGGLFPNGDFIEKFKKLAGDDKARIDSTMRDAHRFLNNNVKDRF